MTPVQRLNREGVEAIQKRNYEKAEALFLKAYLYDPADPFTLNNLGYIAELQGQLERALKFYQLASEQGSTASIDRSNAKQLEGKPITDALNGLSDGPMRVNHIMSRRSASCRRIATLKPSTCCSAPIPWTPGMPSR